MKNVLPLFALIAFAFCVPGAYAATLTVTTTADSGAGSLRAVIAAAAAGDTIQFAAALNGQTITLTSAHLLVDKDLTINGPGANQLTVKRSTAMGTPVFRIFRIAPSHTVTIQGLTINNGVALTGSVGGGIYNNGSTLTIANCIVSGNSATNGGGIYADAPPSSHSTTLTINNSTISGNSTAPNGAGGGIANFGPGDSNFAGMTINNSTISDNSAGYGAGIFNNGQDAGHAFLFINSSTISGNSASQSGGGIYNNGNFDAEEAYVDMSNTTLSGNSAPLGGAIYNDGKKNATGLLIGISTISDNSADQGSGIYNASPSYVSLASIIIKAGPSGGTVSGFSAGIMSSGYNLFSDDGGDFVSATGDEINTDPMLGPLQDNGGPTLTHELLAGSPAINAGYPTYSPPPDYDQRGAGFPRVFDGRLDIGSFERQTGVSPLPSLLNISTRLRVLTGDDALIGGFIVTGNVPKRVIARAIGPFLTKMGIPGALADPSLELHGPGGFVTITNDNWRDTQEAEIEATGVAPSDDLESAIVAMLPPGAYTAVVRGNNGETGVALVEAYDLDSAADARLANISTRGFVDVGNNVMIGGFILGNGSASARVMIRAIGPSLNAAGVPNALDDPTVELHNGNGDTIGANDNWKDTQQAEIEATGIPPTDDRESALVQTLAPGAYTAIVIGKNDTTGVALVEAYRLSAVASPTPTPHPTATPTPAPSPTPTPTPAASPTPTPTPTATVTPTPTATPFGTPTPTPTPQPGAAKFGLLSSSAMVGTGDGIVLNAFIITGPDPKQVIVRGLGPSLGLPAPLADPALDLRTAAGVLIRSNDNWRTDQEAEIIATGIPPQNDLESAIVATLSAGSYTVVLRGVANTTGRGINDLHDLPAVGSSSITAMGTRANVLTGNDALSSGIMIEPGGGDLLVRVFGPSLTAAGVSNVLANPELELRDTNGVLLMANDNWRDTQEAEIQATGLPPTNDLEAALVINLPPGSYTALTQGGNNGTGVGYVQFYSLPHSGPVLPLTP